MTMHEKFYDANDVTVFDHTTFFIFSFFFFFFFVVVWSNNAEIFGQFIYAMRLPTRNEKMHVMK